MSESVYSAIEGYDAFLLEARAYNAQRQGAVAVHVVSDDHRMAMLADHLAFFAPDIDVLTLPAWDCLPYDRVSPNTAIMGERLRVLHMLLQTQKKDHFKATILLTTHAAVTQRLIPADKIEAGNLSIAKGMTLSTEQLSSFLTEQGYGRVHTVREQGEFAIRGGLFDLWPVGHEGPVRLDYFGDEIDSLRHFDVLSQTSGEALKQVDLFQMGELSLSDQAVERFRTGFRDHFGAVSKSHPVYEAISARRRIAGAEHYLPLFFDTMHGITDYCPNALISIEEQAATAATERLDQVADYYETRLSLDEQNKKQKTPPYHPLPPDSLYLSSLEWRAITDQADRFYSHADPSVDGAPAVSKARDFTDIRNTPGADLMQALQEYVQSQISSRHTALALYGPGARERVKAMLEAAGINDVVLCDDLEDLRRLKPGQIGLTILPLTHGFISDDFAIISEQDLLGDRLTRRADKRKVKKKADAFIQDISALNVGDLIVHDDHGVGCFDGLETVEAMGLLHDCLRILYHGGDRLFVPVENIELLSRFGGEEGTTPLDKLGGAGWQARKAKVKKDLLEMAGQLMDLAAERTMRKGDVYTPDPVSVNQFASGFPYAETQDQLGAIEAVMSDLQAGRPMDRLVCGDVGFGKTEIALRAAHGVASQGAQVAVIVPTTLLARQHAANFESRFKGTDVRVAQLSRLVSAKDAAQTKKDIASGDAHIIVGTHALLSESIDFAHLGLVIVDEEQRFGVKQKERLKNLRSNVHVLTLTATPIPRTLQMALTGVRDLSLITTPPVDRLAIRSFVMPFDPFVIREALLREHHRGGQSFVVCPRIKDLEDMAERLAELVPELRVISAHGQLTTTDLEARMQAFIDRDVDVLLATNIIESGLDIPAANTMIVHRADMFGLAQLYQIRGRIGRGKTRAYAYLTYETNKALNETSLKRLDVMATLDQLGSGFQLASHDMDIRGAGNLLGEQQSGHIREVGVELYQQMLEEAVAKVREARSKGESFSASEENYVPQINLGGSVLIPEDYVPDLQVRLNLYRRIGSLVDEGEVEALAVELIDRFGAIPPEVDNLLSVTSIKHLCRKAGVDSLEVGPKGLVLGFYQSTPPNPSAVLAYVEQRAGTIRLRPDQKLFFVRQWTSQSQRVAGVRQILNELMACV